MLHSDIVLMVSIDSHSRLEPFPMSRHRNASQKECSPKLLSRLSHPPLGRKCFLLTRRARGTLYTIDRYLESTKHFLCPTLPNNRICIYVQVYSNTIQEYICIWRKFDLVRSWPNYRACDGEKWLRRSAPVMLGKYEAVPTRLCTELADCHLVAPFTQLDLLVAEPVWKYAEKVNVSASDL